MITGSIDIGVVAMFVMSVTALVVLRKFDVITPDEWLRDLAKEARETLKLRPTPGAINFVTLLILILIFGLYFLVPELDVFFQRLANPSGQEDGSKLGLFVFMVVVFLVVMLLCLKFQKTK